MKVKVKKCSADELEKALKTEDCQLVDVREDFEFESEKIQSCHHLPLSSLNENSLKDLDKDKPLYLVCKSGSRAVQAAEKLQTCGFQNLYVMEGGLNAWRAAGKAVVEGTTRKWSLERQVRFAAGSLVLLGIVFSFFVNRYFLGLSAFVGAGLVFSGITDTCGMGLLLAKMPWNQSRKARFSSCCVLEKSD